MWELLAGSKDKQLEFIIFSNPAVSSINSGHKKSIFFIVFLFFGRKKYDHALSLGAADVFQERYI